MTKKAQARKVAVLLEVDEVLCRVEKGSHCNCFMYRIANGRRISPRGRRAGGRGE